MFSRALAVTALAASAWGQAVISTHAGVVHFFEGAVYLDEQPLESHLGKFASMANGSVLRAAQGRAEVLLSPGVFLRIDQNSSVRMVSNSITDTRVELTSGSAMVDCTEPDSGAPVTLAYKDWRIHFLQKGVYRVDTAPARVWVKEGEAQVMDPATGDAVAVDRGMDLPLALALSPEPTTDAPRDALSTWAGGRAQSIEADNAIASNIQDPGALADQDPVAALGPGPGVDPSLYPAFTQFPMLGLSPYSAMYNSLYPITPGFYSLYLPGYTYQPAFLMLLPMNVRNPIGRYPYSSSSLYVRPGVSTIVTPRPSTTLVRPYPGVGTSTVVRPGAAPAVVRPAAPVVRPAPAPRVGGVHR